MLGVAFPVYVNTYSAIRQIDPGYLELARVVGLGRWQRIRRVVLPGAMPGFLVGVRLATAVAWLHPRVRRADQRHQRASAT